MTTSEALPTLRGLMRMSNNVSDEEFGKLMKENLPSIVEALEPIRKPRKDYPEVKNYKLSCEHEPKYGRDRKVCKVCYDKESQRIYRVKQKTLSNRRKELFQSDL